MEPHPFFKREGDNIDIRVPVTVTEAALGAKIEVPTIDGRTLLKVPPGTTNGQKFRLREKGVFNSRKNLRGDQIVEVSLQAPKPLTNAHARSCGSWRSCIPKTRGKRSGRKCRMAPRSKSKAAYMISSVAEQYEIHPQTLRLYEREGLLKPSRSDGNTRMYTEADLERLEVILHLTRDLGVNLAGVEIILNMREKMPADAGADRAFCGDFEPGTGFAYGPTEAAAKLGTHADSFRGDEAQIALNWKGATFRTAHFSIRLCLGSGGCIPIP